MTEEPIGVLSFRESKCIRVCVRHPISTHLSRRPLILSLGVVTAVTHKSSSHAAENLRPCASYQRSDNRSRSSGRNGRPQNYKWQSLWVVRDDSGVSARLILRMFNQFLCSTGFVTFFCHSRISGMVTARHLPSISETSTPPHQPILPMQSSSILS